jgi:thioredoxin-related protein
MRLPLAVIFLLASPVGSQVPADPQPSAREIALDNLLSERESERAFQSVVADARKNGISEQAILEARFIYHVDRNEDDAIAALLPEFTKLRDSFRIEDSAIFGLKEDWLAVSEYVQAIAALKKGDKDAFKSHITEAFWLSPKQASAFAPHIERMRLEEAMQRVKIDFEIKFKALASGEATALKSLMGDQKAMILHFWSPASRECEESMADFITTAKALTKMKITFVSILPEDSADTLTKARTMIQPLGANAPGSWLIDQKENPLARELRVQALPSFILVSNEGRILFNGAPVDDGLWDALKKIDQQIKRPDSPDQAD